MSALNFGKIFEIWAFHEVLIYENIKKKTYRQKYDQ